MYLFLLLNYRLLFSSPAKHYLNNPFFLPTMNLFLSYRSLIFLFLFFVLLSHQSIKYWYFLIWLFLLAVCLSIHCCPRLVLLHFWLPLPILTNLNFQCSIFCLQLSYFVFHKFKILFLENWFLLHFTYLSLFFCRLLFQKLFQFLCFSLITMIISILTSQIHLILSHISHLPHSLLLAKTLLTSQ